MACGISLECLGLRLDRRRRDRTLIALGWVGKSNHLCHSSLYLLVITWQLHVSLLAVQVSL